MEIFGLEVVGRARFAVPGVFADVNAQPHAAKFDRSGRFGRQKIAALVEDVFYSVYQPAPTLRSAIEVPLSATVNRTILEQLLGTTEWDSLRRAGTIGDQFASALAAAAVGSLAVAGCGQHLLVGVARGFR